VSWPLLTKLGARKSHGLRSLWPVAFVLIVSTKRLAAFFTSASVCCAALRVRPPSGCVSPALCKLHRQALVTPALFVGHSRRGVSSGERNPSRFLLAHHASAGSLGTREIPACATNFCNSSSNALLSSSAGTLRRLLAYLGATFEQITDFDSCHRRWGQGTVRSRFSRAKNLLRIR